MNPSDSVESSQTNEDSKSEHLKYRLKAGAFLTFAGGFGLFGGFAFALAASKKADPKAFDQGLVCNYYMHDKFLKHDLFDWQLRSFN